MSSLRYVILTLLLAAALLVPASALPAAAWCSSNGSYPGRASTHPSRSFSP